MAELKTMKTQASVTAFLNRIADESRRKDCRAVAKLMKQATRKQPKMWGSSVVGFGDFHYRYASGREGDWFVVGFSPRKTDLTLYFMSGLQRFPELLAKLGRYKTGKGCLYLKRLADVDLAVLQRLIAASVRHSSQTQAAGR